MRCDIETEMLDDENGFLKIRTTIKFEHNSFIALETEWNSNNDTYPFKKVGSRITINDLSIYQSDIPVPIAHVQLIENQFRERFTTSSLDTSQTDPFHNLTRVYLATRYDGVGVFIDRIAAAFWVGTTQKVKEVSVEGAALVLKSDRESVIESAIVASKKGWESIRLILAILSIANELTVQVDKIGLVLDDLQNQNPFSNA